MTTQLQHLYPLKIALRSHTLIQGSVFYGVFVDMASGQYVRVVPDPEGNIKRLLLDAGLSEENYELSWRCFQEYMEEFQHPIYQHGLYSMISHWDWYISNLGKFVNYALKYISPRDPDNLNLLRLNRKPFREQIKYLSKTIEIEFIFEDDAVDLVEEMNLVRNLGMHNEWEVDMDYLRKTKTNGWQVGQKRVFEMEEIDKWHSALRNIISVSARDVATRYVHVPKFE